MRRTKSIVILSIIALAISANCFGEVIFSDDFEAGNLDKWVIGGRQQGTNIAEVIDVNGGKVAHLYHNAFTEIMIEKELNYDPNMIFNFDMAVEAYNSYGPTDAHYARGSFEFRFCNSSGDVLGVVIYSMMTSDWLLSYYDNRDDVDVIRIPTVWGMDSYSVAIADVLPHIVIDESQINTVKLSFWAYNSGTNSNHYAHTWVDNVVVNGEATELVGIKIVGPDECSENTDTPYKTMGIYDNGSERDVTSECDWFCDEHISADIDANGVLAVYDVYRLGESVNIYAELINDANFIADKEVGLLPICPSGSALEFNGIDHVNLGNDTSLKPDLPVTLTAWVKMYLFDDNYNQHIISLDNQNFGGRYYGIYMQIGKTGRVSASYCDGGTPSSTSRRGAASIEELETGKWYHVSAVISGHDDIKIFFNGTEQGTTYGGTGGPMVYSDGDSFIGSNYVNSNFLNGVLDEVSVWDVALTEEQIGQIKTAGVDESAVGLIGYWSFDEGEGEMAHDGVGGNDGELKSACDPRDPECEEGPIWVSPGAPAVCSVGGLIVRNTEKALGLKEEAISILDEALIAERANANMLRQLQREKDFSEFKMPQIVRAGVMNKLAMIREYWSKWRISQSMEDLKKMLRILSGEDVSMAQVKVKAERRK